ncbi:hypothetical protein NLU13_6386 [Sarocladium strictum]|uniref:Carboxylic ester hydrolase n=1 Tax=Sarocladium strictum TaxID=5046 RepID=A0AA39L6N5_SARSR|nr:hypothetical protein NLU13_6386 [Sarocladium strictum]
MDKTAQPREIRLAGGSIIALDDGKLIRARGIRYATAVRFQEPQLLASWDSPQDCTQPAPICPQNPSRLGLVNGDLEKDRTQDENCLNLTVVAPVSAENAPVMVFVHGGAWVSGAGDLDAYSPHQLASRGVVAVAISHRLGVFGYLSIPDVASSANLGLLDQIEALRWVKRNIAAFGGDASNVTVFGQSAGADSVYCLAVADVEDQPLFHRGILQSMPASMREDENRTEMTKAMSLHARQTVTPENASTISVSTLLGVQKDLLGVARKISPALLAFGPVMGEYPLPTADKALERFVATSATRPMMFGWTSNEETAFTQIDKRPEAEVYLHNLFQGSTEELTRKIAAWTQQIPVTYELTWHPAESTTLKATHCIDLPLLLGDWDAWKDAPSLQGVDIQQQVERLGHAMKNLWVAFAKGNVAPGTERFIIDKDFTFAA